MAPQRDHHISTNEASYMDLAMLLLNRLVQIVHIWKKPNFVSSYELLNWFEVHISEKKRKSARLVGPASWGEMNGWPLHAQGHQRRHAKETEKPQPWVKTQLQMPFISISFWDLYYVYSNETQMHVIIENWQIQIRRCSSVRNGLDYCAWTMRSDAPDHAAQLSLSHVAHALL